MDMSQVTAETFLRIENGAPDADELAALTAVLLARAAALADDTGTGTDEVRAVARWRRLERSSGHRTPRSWRSAAPGGYGRAA